MIKKDVHNLGSLLHNATGKIRKNAAKSLSYNQF